MEEKRKESKEAIRNRVASLRAKRKAADLVKVEVWVNKDNIELIKTIKSFDESGKVEKNPPGPKPKIK